MKPKHPIAFRLRSVTLALLKELAERADVTQTRFLEDEIERIALTRLGPERVEIIRQQDQAE